MARKKAKKLQENIKYPEPPFKAVLIEPPSRQNEMTLGGIYDIVQVYDYFGTIHFVVKQNIRGQDKRIYWLARHFDVVEEENVS